VALDGPVLESVVDAPAPVTVDALGTPISAPGVVEANPEDMNTVGPPISVVWAATELELTVLDAVGASGLGLKCSLPDSFDYLSCAALSA